MLTLLDCRFVNFSKTAKIEKKFFYSCKKVKEFKQEF